MSTANLTSHVYRHLHKELAAGRLLPGVIVSEKKLAVELGVSRTPVGEAVRQLAAEGLVEQFPRYGTVVKEITRQDIAEVYELREAIEPYAALKAASIISPTQLGQLAVLCRAIEKLAEQFEASDADVLDGDTLRQFLAADMAFHAFIIRAAANSRILKVVQDSQAVSQVFRIRRPVHDSAIVRSACDFHGKILTALRARDGDIASDWMFKHIHQSKEETLAFIDQGSKTPTSSPFPSLDLPEDVRSQLDELERGAGMGDN